MTKQEIISLLTEKHKSFLSVFPSLNKDQFTTSVNGKWSPAQQLDHIIRAVAPVELAFRLPRFISKLMFGKANRPSRSYEDLVDKYHSKLAMGGRASGRFIPKGFLFEDREKTIARLLNLVQKLNRYVEQTTEDDLDFYLLPHPLLGKLTWREMLYFTAYHAEHHEKAIVKNLNGGI